MKRRWMRFALVHPSQIGAGKSARGRAKSAPFAALGKKECCVPVRGVMGEGADVAKGFGEAVGGCEERDRGYTEEDSTKFTACLRWAVDKRIVILVKRPA